MAEQKLDYAGLKRVAPSPHDLKETEMYPLEQMLGKVTIGPTAPAWFVPALQRSNANPHTVLI